MRADRLVAILLMLQTRGRVTAGEVAVELPGELVVQDLELGDEHPRPRHGDPPGLGAEDVAGDEVPVPGRQR